MKLIQLKRNPKAYSSFAYLVLGSWNRLEDINTLVDVGIDAYVLDEIEGLSTGCGKWPVEQVVLTHNHFDHVNGLAAIKERYRPKVFAFADSELVDELLEDGQVLRMGDRDFEVIHAPGHSEDSICLYCHEERVLFSGDLSWRILTVQGTYTLEHVALLERLASLEIQKIYSGHDPPVTQRVNEMIRNTVSNVKRSRIVTVCGKG
jgi:glyoxylase-like metal-dependent hydrolase (beta-lactamase superfamily II)